MQLLTEVGCNTGFDDAVHGFCNHRSAGQEIIVSPTANEYDRKVYADVQVIKDPRLCWTLRGVLDRRLFEVDHVIIPVREVAAVSTSRISKSMFVLGAENKPDVRKPARQQTRFMYESLGHLFETLAVYEIDYTTIQYPRFVSSDEWHYLYERLLRTSLLDGVTPKQFEAAHRAIMDTGRITIADLPALPYIQKQRDGVPFSDSNHINRQVTGWRGDTPDTGRDK